VTGVSQISRDELQRFLNWYNSLSDQTKAVLAVLSGVSSFALKNTLTKVATTLGITFGIVELFAGLSAFLLGVAGGVGWVSMIDAFFQCENLL